MSDTTPIAPSVGRAGVLAGLARAGSVGGLSVPQAWGGVTGEMPRAAMAIPAPTLVGFPEAEVDPLGAGGGGILPGSLMARGGGRRWCGGRRLCRYPRSRERPAQWNGPARRHRPTRRDQTRPIPPPCLGNPAGGSRSRRRREAARPSEHAGSGWRGLVDRNPARQDQRFAQATHRLGDGARCAHAFPGPVGQGIARRVTA